ncbi:insulinase family protein [Kineosporia mesophila]|nr:insulinase family protein [Kineosporia mesophila]MCD5355120.1 insulinase family protein [Kineosporia mesophila]
MPRPGCHGHWAVSVGEVVPVTGEWTRPAPTRSARQDPVALVRARIFPAGHRYAGSEGTSPNRPGSRELRILDGAAAHTRLLVVEAGPQVPGKAVTRNGSSVAAGCRGEPGPLTRQELEPEPEPEPERVPVVPGPGWYLLGLPGVALADRRKTALHLACDVLGGPGGVLARRLGAGTTYSLSVFSRELADAGYLTVMVCAAPERLAGVRAGVRAVLRDLERELTDEAIDRSRSALLVRHLDGDRHADDVAVRTATYLAADAEPGAAGDEVCAMGRDEVRRFAGELLRGTGAAELYLVPEGAADSAPGQGFP